MKSEHIAEEEQNNLVNVLAEKTLKDEADEEALKNDAAHKSALLEEQAERIQDDPDALAALEVDQKDKEEANAEAEEIVREASGAARMEDPEEVREEGRDVRQSGAATPKPAIQPRTGFVEVAKHKRTIIGSPQRHEQHQSQQQEQQESPEAAAEKLMRQAQMVFD